MVLFFIKLINQSGIIKPSDIWKEKETQIYHRWDINKIGSELIWLWVAIGLENKEILGIRISKEKCAVCSKGFKHGRYNTIVTAKGLDEDMYVLDTESTIASSAREFIQRHRRLSRSKFDVSKKSKLIEMISNNTTDTRTGAKRKEPLHKVGVRTCNDDIITAVIR